MSNKENRVCDLDCFNCKFDDCICDSTKSPYGIIHQVRKKQTLEEKRAKKNEKAKEYYRQHREKCIAQASARYYRNREEILRKKREKNANKSK